MISTFICTERDCFFFLTLGVHPQSNKDCVGRNEISPSLGMPGRHLQLSTTVYRKAADRVKIQMKGRESTGKYVHTTDPQEKMVKHILKVHGTTKAEPSEPLLEYRTGAYINSWQ